MSNFLGNALSELVKDTEPPNVQTNSAQSRGQNHFMSGNFLKRALESRTNRTNTQRPYRALGSPEVHRIVLLCSLYYTALNTLTQLKLDILTGN